MVSVNVGSRCSEDEVVALLRIMEELGREGRRAEFKESIMADLPASLTENKEHIIRYLLLVAILDQQAETPSARRAARFIYETFHDDLFKDPQQVMLNFHRLKPLDTDAIYRISPAIGRATPRFAWIILRVGGFLIYQLNLNNQRVLLHERLKNCNSPEDAVGFLYSSEIVRSLLREKAARLYLLWIGHPDLMIDVSDGRWDRVDFQMPVDGHVGKVFSRTGILQTTIVETVKAGSERKDIIKAVDLRGPIEQVVKSRRFDPGRVDYGAFHIGITYCHENPSEAECSICPLGRTCKKNMRWHAY